MCNHLLVPRRYKLQRRAERQAETRRRIVEAAVELHTELGPARTTVSAIAERAGVQRHTFYAHFPDERELALACSGLHLERDPPPDPERWRPTRPGGPRLRLGLTELYGYYERNEQLLGNVLRDAEVDALTREIVELRLGAGLARMLEVLAERLPERERVRAALWLALDFAAWRALRLPPADAAEAMARAVEAQ